MVSVLRCRTARLASVTFISLMLAFVPGCDESLPPRLDDPSSLTFESSLLSGIVEIKKGEIGGAGIIELDFTNLYNDVLQDTAQVVAELDLWMPDYPDARAHVRLGESALVDSTLITRGILTLLPGKRIRLASQWSHKTLGGAKFSSFIPSHPVYGRDTSFMETKPTKVMMSGTFQVFKKLPAYTVPPTSATITYRDYDAPIPPPFEPKSPIVVKGKK